MDKLKEFYNSVGFIISFLFISVLISAMFGEKFLNKFLILVLVSQLIFNSDKAVSLINSFKITSEKVTSDVKSNDKTIKEPDTEDKTNTNVSYKQIREDREAFDSQFYPRLTVDKYNEIKNNANTGTLKT